MPGLWKPHGRPPDQSSLFDYDMKRHKHVLCYATENLPVTADSLTLIIHPEMETQMVTWESPNFSLFIPHIIDKWSNFPEATKILVPWSVLEPRFPIPQWDLHKSLGRLVLHPQVLTLLCLYMPPEGHGQGLTVHRLQMTLIHLSESLKAKCAPETQMGLHSYTKIVWRI